MPPNPVRSLAQDAVLALNVAALLAASLAALAVVAGGPWGIWLRVAATLFTAAFLVCGYGAYRYQRHASIGAAFAVTPDDQFWA